MKNLILKAMKIRLFFLFLFLALFLVIVLFTVYGSTEMLFFSSMKLLTSDLNLLLLGKPGPGYIAPENTDSIMVVHYSHSKNKLFIIPVPRDLIVRNEEGSLEKINAFYEKKKIDFLLEKVSNYTGFKVKNYLVFDLTLVKNLIDFLGGVDIVLKEPVVDPVSFYTLSSGKHHLDSYLMELVLRSRYNSRGDFFRLENQIETIKDIKDKMVNLDSEGKIKLFRLFEQNSSHWESNLKKENLVKIFLQIRNIKNLEIVPLVIDLNSGLLQSGNFQVYNTNNVFGIYPKLGVDNYEDIKNYIQSRAK